MSSMWFQALSGHLDSTQLLGRGILIMRNFCIISHCCPKLCPFSSTAAAMCAFTKKNERLPTALLHRSPRPALSEPRVWDSSCTWNHLCVTPPSRAVQEDGGPSSLWPVVSPARSRREGSRSLLGQRQSPSSKAALRAVCVHRGHLFHIA